MSPLEKPGPGWDSADAGNARADALDTLSDALSWRLADTRWAAIEPVLAAMDAALAAGDVAALADATTDLDLFGPMRVTRLGTVPVVPPPPAIRDRLNQLVHSLGGVQAADEPEPGEQQFSG